MHYFVNAFDCLCQKTDPVHHNRCPVALGTKPQVSVILPLIEDSVLRMAVGSHKEVYSRSDSSLHGESFMNVLIPPTFAIIFMSGRTIHGGGPSTLRNTRVFSIYSPEDIFTTLDNKNYRGRNVSACLDTCQKCLDLKHFKDKVCGDLFPCFDEWDYDIDVGELLFHFNIKQHGFCVLKVTTMENLTQQVINEVNTFERGGNGVTFRAMGQEEDTSLNNRKILNVGGYLDEFLLIADKWKGRLNDYHSQCSLEIESFLATTFDTTYKHRGMTVLTNTGNVDMQSLHLDSMPDCKCDQLLNDI
jgi:hypothetical protein